MTILQCTDADFLLPTVEKLFLSYIYSKKDAKEQKRLYKRCLLI